MSTTQAEKPLHDRFGMFSKAGNARVKTIVKQALRLPMNTADKDLYAFLTERMNKVAETHGEVWDTAVREHIIGAIEDRTKRRLSIYF